MVVPFVLFVAKIPASLLNHPWSRFLGWLPPFQPRPSVVIWERLRRLHVRPHARPLPPSVARDRDRHGGPSRLPSHPEGTGPPAGLGAHGSPHRGHVPAPGPGR